MLNITNHQENANQNHEEIPLTCHDAYHKKDKIQEVLVRMQRKGNPLTLLVAMQLSTATTKNSVEAP